MPDGDIGSTDTAQATDTANKAADSTLRLPPLAQAPPLAVSSDDLRALVLDYLSHSCFVDSALAFVKEWEQIGQAPVSSTLFLPYTPVAGSSGSPYVGTASSSSGGQEGQSVTAGAAASSSSRPPASPEHYHDVEDDDADDGQDLDVMMQSVHSTFDTRATGTNGNGETTNYPGSKYLSPEELEQIRARKEIRRLIRQGSIQSAIDLCQYQFPTVLSSPSATSTSNGFSSAGYGSSSSSGWARESRQSLAPSSLLGFFSKRVSARTPEFPAQSSAPRYTNDLISRALPAQPSLLALSLQIQRFIEVVRSSAPAPAGSSAGAATGSNASRPSTPFNNANSPGSNNGSMEGSTASLNSTASQGSHASGISVLSTGSTGSTSAISMALSQAQDLHARASQIADPATKTAYLKELECVSGLLPYRDPRMSPMAHYLDERRRDVLAEAVNGAIMLSIGKVSTNSKLENLVRQSDQVWQSLQDLKSTYPPERGSNKNNPPKPIWAYTLQDFLDTNQAEEV